MILENLLDKLRKIRNIGYESLAVLSIGGAIYIINDHYLGKIDESVTRIEESLDRSIKSLENSNKSLAVTNQKIRKNLEELNKKSQYEHEHFMNELDSILRQREFEGSIPIPYFPGWYLMPIPPWSGPPPIIAKPYRGDAKIVPLKRD